MCATLSVSRAHSDTLLINHPSPVSAPSEVRRGGAPSYGAEGEGPRDDFEDRDLKSADASTGAFPFRQRRCKQRRRGPPPPYDGGGKWIGMILDGASGMTESISLEVGRRLRAMTASP